MTRLKVAITTLTAVSVAVLVAGIWWGHSLFYLCGSAVLYIITAWVWLIWVRKTWNQQLDADDSSNPPHRFL